MTADVSPAVHGMAQGVETLIKNHPIPALLISFGIGYCVGRVMTESDVVELPESAEEREESTVPPKPTLGNYVLAVIEALLETPSP